MDQAIRHLTNKHSSSSNVYNALVSIRTNYVKDDVIFAEFRRLGGLQALIYHLQKPNLKVVNIALSILGNCCMDVQSRILVRKHGGILHVVNLLESFGQSDIQNRACRVLANLALDVQSGDEIIKRNGAKLVIDVLTSSSDEHTRVSALRAIRSLATTPKQRQHIIKHSGVESICKLLIQDESAAHEVTAPYILKALAALTVDCSLECSLQLQNVQYAEKLVAYLPSPNDQITTLALRVLSNLSRQETIRPLLGSAGAVPLLIKHVAKWERHSPGWQHAVISLCQCTKECNNRSRINEEEGLIHLITLLGDREDDRLWQCSLAAIVNFLFDSKSFTKLLELGLVTVLVERFRELIMNTDYTAHDYDLNRRTDVSINSEREETSPSESGVGSGLALAGGHQLGEAFSRGRRSSQASPRSYCQSPECSPPYWMTWGGVGHLGSPPAHSPLSMSPAALSPYRAGPSSCSSGSSERRPDVAEDGDFCYSPVYEDDDADEDMDGVEAVASETTGIVEDSVSRDTPVDGSQVIGDVEEDEEDLSRLRGEGQVGSPLSDVIMLLSRVSWQEDPRMSFVSCGGFEAIFDYVIGTQKPSGRAQRMLLRVLRNPLYFECLLMYRIPQFLYKRLSEVEHPTSGCSLCKTVDTVCRLLITNISLQAESAYGCGVVLHWLVGKTEPEQKLLAIIAANYLLSSCRSIRKVYVESIGLSYLCQALENVSHSDYEHLLGSVIHLTRSLLSQTPIAIEENYDEPSSTCHYAKLVTPIMIEAANDDTVILVVRTESDEEDQRSLARDGVVVSRSFLGGRCDVFNAMLNGNFAETRSRSIFIGDTTLEGLGYIVHHLHGCCSTICPIMHDAATSVATMLQALATADRFLMPDLKLIVAKQLTRCSERFDDDEWMEVLTNAKLYGCPELVRWVYVDLFTSETSTLNDKRRRLCRWMSGDRHSEIAADLQTLLHEAMTVKLKTC